MMMVVNITQSSQEPQEHYSERLKMLIPHSLEGFGRATHCCPWLDQDGPSKTEIENFFFLWQLPV